MRQLDFGMPTVTSIRTIAECACKDSAMLFENWAGCNVILDDVGRPDC